MFAIFLKTWKKTKFLLSSKTSTGMSKHELRETALAKKLPSLTILTAREPNSHSSPVLVSASKAVLKASLSVLAKTRRPQTPASPSSPPRIKLRLSNNPISKMLSPRAS